MDTRAAEAQIAKLGEKARARSRSQAEDVSRAQIKLAEETATKEAAIRASLGEKARARSRSQQEDVARAQVKLAEETAAKVAAAQARRVRPGEGPQKAQLDAAVVAAKKIEEIENLKFKRVRNAAEAHEKQLIDARAAAAEESAKRVGQISQKALATPKSGIAGFVQNLQQRFQGLGASVGLTGSAIAQVFKVGFTGSVVVLGLRLAIGLVKKLHQGFQEITKEASNLHEAQQAVNITFGEGSEAVTKFARSATGGLSSAASGLGLSATEALTAARTFGTFFQVIGEGETASAELAQVFTTLSADIAAFTNATGGAAEVTRSLEQALGGNFRSLQKYGFVIKEADVRQRLLTSGIVNNVSQLTPAVKEYGNAILIIERFEKTIGTAAREFDNLNATQQRLTAATTDLKAKFGEFLEPLAAQFNEALAGGVKLLTLLLDFTPILVEIQRNAEFIFGPLLKLLIFIDRLSKGSEDEQRKRAAAAKAQLERGAKVTAQLEAEAEAQLHVADNTIKLLQAQQAAISADNALIQSKFGLVRAEEALDDLRREQARLPLKIAEAELGLKQARLENARAAFFVGDAERSLQRAREDQVDAARNYVRAQEDITVAQRNLRRAEEDIVPAVRKAQRAREDQIQAIQDLADVQRELADNRPILEATQAFEEAQLKVKDATLAIREALIDQLEAQLALIDAEDSLGRAQRRGNAGRRDQLKATIDLRKANLDQARASLSPERALIELRGAILDLAKAQSDLAKALSGVTAFQKLRDAVRGVEDANQGVIDADRGVEDAHQSVTDAGRNLEDAHIAVRDSLRGVEDAAVAVRNGEFELAAAHLSVESTALSLARAQNALDDVLIESERAPQRLAEAQQGLKEAHDAVTAAALAAALAHLEVTKALAEGEGIILSDTELLRELNAQLLNMATFGNDAAAALERLNAVPFRQLAPGDIGFDSPEAREMLLRHEGEYWNGSRWVPLKLGGPLAAGRLALVGEKGMEICQAAGGKSISIGADGPEFFRPSVSGRVIPNSQINQFMRVEASKQAARSTTTSTTTHHREGDTFNIYEQGGADERVLAFRLSKEIARKGKR